MSPLGRDGHLSLRRRVAVADSPHHRSDTVGSFTKHRARCAPISVAISGRGDVTHQYQIESAVFGRIPVKERSRPRCVGPKSPHRSSETPHILASILDPHRDVISRDAREPGVAFDRKPLEGPRNRRERRRTLSSPGTRWWRLPVRHPDRHGPDMPQLIENILLNNIPPRSRRRELLIRNALVASVDHDRLVSRRRRSRHRRSER